MAIGSRALRREWIGIHQSGQREAAGKVFNFFTRLLTGLDFRDTQCGFKVFRREAAHTIFAAQRINRWGFDVEALFIAQKHRLSVRQTAVFFRYDEEPTTVRFAQSAFTMATELLKIRVNDWRGRYD